MADLTNWQYFLPNDHKRRPSPRRRGINREDVTPSPLESRYFIEGHDLWRVSAVWPAGDVK